MKFYCRSADDAELVVQTIPNPKAPLSIRVTEPGEASSSVVELPIGEIAGLCVSLDKARRTLGIPTAKSLPTRPSITTVADSGVLQHAGTVTYDAGTRRVQVAVAAGDSPAIVAQSLLTAIEAQARLDSDTRATRLAWTRREAMRQDRNSDLAFLLECLDAETKRADEALKGPGIVWSANGQAGDSTGRCEVCGDERDEPHSWEACARRSAEHELAMLNRSIEAQVTVEEEARFWKQQTLRAMCRCAAKDCLSHGAYVHSDWERVAEARKADLERYRDEVAAREASR